MKLSDAITKLNKDKTDKEAQTAADGYLQGKAALWVRDDGKIDAAKTAEAIDFLEEADIQRFVRGERAARCKTLAEFVAKQRPRVEADPTTGAALDPDGVSQDEAGIDWSRVPKSRREWVLYGRDTGAIDRHPGTTLRRQWARELAMGEVNDDWKAIAAEVNKLKTREAEALTERLYYVRQPAPFVQAAEPPFPGEAASKPCAADSYTASCGLRNGSGKCGDGVPGSIGSCGRRVLGPPAGSVTIGRDATGSTIVTGSGNHVGAAKHEQVYIVVSEAARDKAAANDLRDHLFLVLDRKRAPGTDEVRPGQYTSDVWMREMGRASIVLMILTKDLLNDDGRMALIEHARAQGKRVIPIKVAATLVLGWLAQSTALPRSGYLKDNEADVAREIAALVRGLP